MNNADLHIHSNVSDGLLSPGQIVDWGLKKGLRALAITDHDSMSGIDTAIRYSKDKNIEVVPGIELSTEFENSEVHILGYYMNYKSNSLNQLLNKIRDSRVGRAKKMVQLLKNMGYGINFEDVSLISRDAESIGRPHIARILVNKGYCSDISDAFNRLIGYGKPAYAERFKLSPFQALETIIKSGGAPVIAHPGLIMNIDIDLFIQRLKRWGLVGIEVYHTKHTNEDSIRLSNIAHRLNLIPTGGSDCHGTMVNGEPILGSISVPYENVERIRKAAAANKGL
jgi:Predicted metal-dependent phosphoesterases (PHP family)